ncbi:MAG: type II toxin-antitoxin system prevent-host-death family antitoxin [Erysipelotrichaceae bacterium]|nr:type II toxin-antitoxin system prevent-host-death family antitoxin [Erysipelotrichaceae bacterium]
MMILANATEMKNMFGKYLDLAMKNGEVHIVKHGEIVARLVASNGKKSYLADNLSGIGDPKNR